jgi:hypothetical protein
VLFPSDPEITEQERQRLERAVATVLVGIRLYRVRPNLHCDRYGLVSHTRSRALSRRGDLLAFSRALGIRPENFIRLVAHSLSAASHSRDWKSLKSISSDPVALRHM